MSAGWGSPQAELRAEHILRAVESIPPGCVCAYGDIASIVGCGPRQVGAVLRRHGSAVPWWRVVSHDGRSSVAAQALPHWRAEGIGVRDDLAGCHIAQHRVDLASLEAAYRRAAAALPTLHDPVSGDA